MEVTALERYEPWPAMISAPSQAALRRELGRAHRRGELAASGPIYQHGTRYAVDVLRLKPRRRVPVWAVVAGAVIFTLVLALAAGWWLAMTLPLPAAIGGGAVLLFVLAGRRTASDRGCTITHTRH